ncbi:hypothetical protein T09_9105 [Trichinella sp. T9]|uniref:Uncharacterized protein n=1 Tax=Trichinella murrelli TaxID=144512 RepID=A0A0V0TMD7_9BILA|nr:hypothetical protein T05_10079 [Trichinella murrelli]KRX60030.1 hypothetical protein T09_9105 [Trichinella sp. T9]
MTHVYGMYAQGKVRLSLHARSPICRISDTLSCPLHGPLRVTAHVYYKGDQPLCKVEKHAYKKMEIAAAVDLRSF